ncbi:MAG: PEP-CTERM sorting domain-containing protein [Pirellulales bacterium]|nr:PEP-CTERM sorting domain-containing protein [Pirellulales bacterium]
MKRTAFLTLGVAAALAVKMAAAAPLYTDDFNTAASAANYNLVQFGTNAVSFAYDYSVMGIPPAPNTTDASTLGVKFESNHIQPAAAAAVTLHTNQSFSGSYKVKFDAWINANGPFPGGGTGSTEFLTAGVGGDGTTVNRSGATGSGGWTAVDGEGGSGVDYRLLRGAALQGLASAGTTYAAGSQAASNAYYLPLNPSGVDVSLLPVQGAGNGGPAQQTGTTIAGTFGFAWHQVELAVDETGGTGGAALLTWKIDGLLIGTMDAGAGTAFSTNGRVTIGYTDPFASFSDNPLLSFGLIDNLVVVPEPTSLGLAGLAALAALRIRRRW